ncbi:IS3 family transposase [Lactiplantibacillus plantarum]|uniref:IS3 family transposase n=1 Tax=Lactiplantibacillus plantarum TaxID=1590 RepID=UPI0039B76C68
MEEVISLILKQITPKIYIIDFGGYSFNVFEGLFYKNRPKKRCPFSFSRYLSIRRLRYSNNYRYQWNLKKMTPIQYRRHLQAA